MEYILTAVLIAVLIYQEIKDRRLSKTNTILATENNESVKILKELQSELVNTQDELGSEREKNRTLLSQKKSSETRLGQISEHLVPFLENCRHDPKNMHFLSAPIDYVIFNFDDGNITFLEVKSGNSKPSKRQKIIKNIIKSGRVYYEELRINERGIRNKIVKGEELSVPVDFDEDENNETLD